LEQERLEGFLRIQVENGESLRDAYPPGPRLREAYDAWCRENPHG
ncbi:MAG: ribonuclease activity regulator RraA, partial [Proteobacteria bacterium]|nr:ribonuclease activity regulator RraA [Pseudomonadota bacterium]